MTEPAAQPVVTASSYGAVQILALYSETALHPGSGSTTGAIDLPIQRERHTEFPIIPPTGLKGSLRQVAEGIWPSVNRRSDPIVATLFGPQTAAEENLHAGAIGFGEARLVAFPVRSSSEVFVWVTCPLVLDRLRRDLALAGITLPTIGHTPGVGVALAPTKSQLSDNLILEDLSFKRREQAEMDAVAAVLRTFLPSTHAEVGQKLARNLLLITDRDYQHLVRTATTVAARIALNDQKTTTGGGLWYEETLPRDCLFTTLLRFERPRGGASPLSSAQAVQTTFAELITAHPYVQVGGNETVGQGWCAIRLVSPIAAGGE